jgi:hypothetical protein
MSTLTIVIIGYLITLVINSFLIRKDQRLCGWLAMLADPRHGRLLNSIALIVVFVPPVLWFILLFRLLQKE